MTLFLPPDFTALVCPNYKWSKGLSHQQKFSCTAHQVPTSQGQVACGLWKRYVRNITYLNSTIFPTGEKGDPRENNEMLHIQAVYTRHLYTQAESGEPFSEYWAWAGPWWWSRLKNGEWCLCVSHNALKIKQWWSLYKLTCTKGLGAHLISCLPICALCYLK